MISLSHYRNSPKRRSPAPRWSSSDSPVWFFSRQTYRRTYCIFIYFFWFVLSLFICIFLTVLFVSISKVIGCEDCLRNDLYCVEWGVKLYSNSKSVFSFLCPLTAWHCPLLHTSAATISGIFYLLGPQQQTCHMLLQWANRTDRWTDLVLFHRPCSTYCAGSTSNCCRFHMLWVLMLERRV